MKVDIRLLGVKYIRKVYVVTATAYNNLDQNVFARNFKVLQCSRRRLRTFSSAGVNSNTVFRKPPWRVLFFGTDDFSLSSLKMLYKELQDGGLVKELAIVTSLKAKNNVVRDFALETELSTFNWPFRTLTGDFDVGLVASFGHLIPQHVIESFPLGILNVHASLLPRWRGAAPIIYSILNGDTETGVTIMQVKAHKFDIGNIVLQQSCHIAPTDTAPLLRVRLAELGSRLLQEVLRDLPHYLHRSTPQPQSGVTYAPRVTSSLAVVNWQEMDAVKVHNLHRALTGLYSLTTKWHGLQVKLLEPSLHVGTSELEQQNRNRRVLNTPGCVALDDTRSFLLVLCADNQWIGFRALSVPGKKPMSPKDFYNGYLSKRNVTEWVFT